MKRMWCGLLLLAACAMGLEASAQYWISVGSYRDAAAAQAGVRALADRVAGPLTVTRYESAGVYRIVMGPYPSMDGAREVLAGVRAQAVPDAWIVTESGGVQPAAAEYMSESRGEYVAPAAMPRPDWTETTSGRSLDIEALLRLARAPLPEPSATAATQRPISEAPAEPVTTVPEGYQLHMLRRVEGN